jgi:hypothetical protein
MPVYKTVSALAMGALVTVSALGCSDDDEATGTLQQNWTINGSTDPSSCGPVGATQMRLVVIDSAGYTDATQFAPCTDFRATVSLIPDRYTAAVTFLGANGAPVSKTQLVPIFDIYSGQTTTVGTNFTLTDFIR